MQLLCEGRGKKVGYLANMKKILNIFLKTEKIREKIELKKTVNSDGTGSEYLRGVC